jgi:signal transduction histidine kinase/DNA-binding response OmpR family regulator/putative methionine-R-sulfoxide reductase with GAF domain
MLARALGQFPTPVEILTAHSGQEALEVIGDKGLAVLITDFMMPGMNGLELIEKLQGGREPAHSILITAYDSPGLAAIARRLQVNDYLVKPVQPDKIRAIVAKVLEGLTAPKPRPAEAPAPSQFKILVADDRPDNVHLLATRLTAEGYAFITAADGEETLTQLRAELPDLVLLDVNMPKKSGFDVLAEMRSDPAIAHIPVIILTAARISPRDVREGLSLGADDYITKPFDWRELAARVRAKLRVKHAEDALRRRNRELGLLPEIGQDLSARLDVEELAHVTLQRSVEAVNATSAHIIIYQPDSTAVHQMVYPPEALPWSRPEVLQRFGAEGVVVQVSESRASLIVADTKSDAHWLSLAEDPARSAIGLPLLTRRGVLGVLTLIHEGQSAYFTSDHAMLLQAIVSQAAIAIENAQFHAIERKRVNELVALNQLTREISLFTRSAELFERVPGLIQSALGYPIVSLWLIENGAAKLMAQSEAEGVKGLRLSLLSLAPQQVAVSGEPTRLSGEVEERITHRTGVDIPPTQSAIAVPLFWQAQASGVLAIHSTEAQVFQESDRVVLETIASQIATALERIRLFESVEHERHRLAAILHGAADAILVTDSAGSLQLANPAGERLFTDVNTQLGHPLPAGRGYDDLITLLDEVRASVEPTHKEIPWPDKRTFSVMVTPIEEGGQVAVLHDVTHFKNLERVKNEFIATASHDLKNPLTSILGYSNLMAIAGPLTDQQKTFVERMQYATNQMHDLVQGLLELARVDMGVELRLEKYNLSEILSAIATEFQGQADSKKQALTWQAPPQDPFVRVDLMRIQQVFRNLVSNAIKYTPEGGRVTLSVTTLNGKLVRVAIQDTGLGIPATDVPFIFDKFYRVSAHAAQDIEGHGLGLAIVKSIVEQHGGEVRVESTVGEGSTFLVTLPVPAATAE